MRYLIRHRWNALARRRIRTWIHPVTAAAVIVALAAVSWGQPPVAPATSPAREAALLPTGTPTLEELNSLLDEGKSAEVLQQVARINGSRKFLAAYNKMDLLVLKANALLASKDRLDALTYFQQVVTEAPDLDHQAYAFASALIVQRAAAFIYTPRTALAIKAATGPDGKTATYDVRDVHQRKVAFNALFLDEAAACTPAIQAALQATALPPTVKPAQALADLQLLELAATGDDRTYLPVRRQFAAHITTLIRAGLRQMNQETEGIAASANELVDYACTYPDGSWETGTRRRGLSTAQAAQLRTTLAACNTLTPTIQGFIERLRSAAKPLEPLLEETATLAQEARNVLTSG